MATQKALSAQHELLMTSRAELTASLDRYAELFYFAPVAYVTLNRAGQIVEINHAAAVMFGEHRAFLTASLLANRMVPEDADKFTQHLRRCKQTPKEVATDLRLLRRDGSSFPCASHHRCGG